MSSPENKKKNKWKKVIQVVAAYLVAAWTFLQFLDWTLVRYQISPYWVDILLWVFVGVLPSLIIYLFNAERINDKKIKLREKIIFPTNFLILGTVLYFFFGSTDLGSTTKQISFTNEFGTLETQTITKEEFRIGIPIYNFQQKAKDTANSWIGNTINELIKLDLDQDKNFAPEKKYSNNTVEKVKASSIFHKYYVDGEYEVKDGVYNITSTLRNSKNGKEVKRTELSGEDFFALIDQISVFIKENLLVRDELIDRYIDLDIKEITTESMKALKLWSNREYEKAVEEDKTFALAYFYNAQRRTTFSQGELEEKYLIDKAYRYKDKLPYQLQFEILMYKHIVYNRWDDAEELLKYQLEIEPNNVSYNRLLYIIYSETKNLEGFYNHAKNRFDKIKNEKSAQDYYVSLMLNSKYKKAKNLIKLFELLAPDVEEVTRIKAYTFLLSGDIDEAEKIYKKINLRWPKESIYRDLVEEYITYKRNNNNLRFDKISQSGVYRSPSNEQQVEYFEKDGGVFIHYKNQIMNRGIVSKNNRLLSLDPTWVSGTHHIFVKDSLDSIYKVKINQFNRDKSSIFYYFKETEEIRSAYELLKSGKKEGLKETFELLIEKYPNHWFLKDILQHLNYIESLDSQAIQKQFSKIAGTYSNRVFWVEDNKLYYKRDNLTRIELLPISKTRYINLSKYVTNLEFEFLKENKIASFAWSYDLEKDEWVKLDGETNYFLKN